MRTAADNFRHLNRDGRWLEFSWTGLERTEPYALQLARVPATEAAAAIVASEGAGVPEVSAGLTVDCAGNVFFSAVLSDRIMRVDSCAPETAEPCFGGSGSHPGQLRSPRGLAYNPERGAIYVCDHGNHRVQIFGAERFDVREIWQFGALLATPIDITIDGSGCAYVIDEGTARVQKVRPTGDLEPAFAETCAASGLLSQPLQIAAITDIDSAGTRTTRIYVLDSAARSIFVFDELGALVGPGVLVSALQQPMGLAVTNQTIYVGDHDDAGLAHVRCFDRDGVEIGEAHDTVRSVAALCAHDQKLFVYDGENTPCPLALFGAYARTGKLVSPAVDLGRAVAWYSLQLTSEPLPEGTHLQVRYSTSDDAQVPGPFVTAPWDATQIFLGNTGARYMWLEVEFVGDGLATPTLSNLTVRFDQPGYLASLPAVFGAPGADREFLVAFLALFEGLNVDLQTAIARLPEFLSPESIPADSLAWLASFLSVELDGQWSEDKQRSAIARAYRSFAARGTVQGLREALAFETGVDSLIVEPATHAAFWGLPDVPPPCGPSPTPDDGTSGSGSILGFTTQLPAADAQGAVVDAATFDQARLLDDSDLGRPLFDDTAHQFVVYVYRGAADRPDVRAALTRVIEREKPAHTSYCLRSIEPQLSVGMQAILGVDSIVGGPKPVGVLSETTQGEFSLAGNDAPRIGRSDRIGKNLSL